MAAHKRASRLRKSRGEPSQLNLFEAPERKAAPKPAAPLRVKTKRAIASRVERPVVLSPRDAAAYLKVAVSTLKSWRAKNIGPAWRRRGSRLICYFPADLDAFLDGGVCGRDKP